MLNILKPTLMVFSERDLRLFVGQADVFISDSEIGEDLAKFLFSIGVPRDLQDVVPDMESVVQLLQPNILRAQEVTIAAKLKAQQNLDN
ncbi:MAG: hypothetical protein ACYC10_20265 [Allorhizobium sp.]